MLKNVGRKVDNSGRLIAETKGDLVLVRLQGLVVSSYLVS